MSSTGEVDLRCATCAKIPVGTKLCGKCLSVRYCSRECQKKNWHSHKATCRASVTPAIAQDNTQASHHLYSLKDIPGKGQGLVASTKISRGTRILSEAYIFEVNRRVHDIEEVNDQVQTAVGRLQSHQREAFFALHNVHGNIHGLALGIARTNALPLGANADKGGVFLEASRINHSCSHNAQNTWNSQLRKLTIHAVRDIQKGEEICISYLDGFEDYATRQVKLKKSFSFSCCCILCSLPEDLRQQNDVRRNEMQRLDHQIGDGMRITSAPLSCLHDAYKMLTLLREEQISNAWLPRLYYDAFQIVIANGDEARARVFAKMAHDERAIIEGYDSPDVTNLKNLMDNPSSHMSYGMTMKWRQAVSNVPSHLDSQEFEKWLWKRK